MITHSLLSLRPLLIVDALSCALMGAGLTFFAGAIAHLTELPSDLLFYSGLSLFPIAAFMALIAGRPVMHRGAVSFIVLGNALWVVGSVAVLTATSPNVLGMIFVAGQAIFVAVMAALERSAANLEGRIAYSNA